MAKIIKFTDKEVAELQAEFTKALQTAKFPDGKFSFIKNFNSMKRDAVLYFTADAWRKMQALIKDFDKEVGWHGIATRGADESRDEYIISDILVYPQEVTSATVTTDQEKYQTWLMCHDDEIFNNIRMQGHSHVNMGVTPSSVDNSLYERILEQLEDDMFYIFLIWNKRGDKTIKIYDLAKNVLFDTSDVTVKVFEDSVESVINEPMTEEEYKEVIKFLAEFRASKKMNGFVDDAKKMVQNKVYTPIYTPAPAKPAPPAAKKEEPKNVSAPVKASVPAKKVSSNKPRKGKRSKDTKASTAQDRWWYDDYDIDNPFGAFGYRDSYYR